MKLIYLFYCSGLSLQFPSTICTLINNIMLPSSSFRICLRRCNKISNCNPLVQIMYYISYIATTIVVNTCRLIMGVWKTDHQLYRDSKYFLLNNEQRNVLVVQLVLTTVVHLQLFYSTRRSFAPKFSCVLCVILNRARIIFVSVVATH